MTGVTLSAEDIEDIRRLHHPSPSGRMCMVENAWWPCDAVRLLATIDTLEAALAAERQWYSAGISRLTKSWEDPKGRGQ